MQETELSMKRAISHLETELAKIRAGKATPQMLDGIHVDYYGNATPINQVGNINVMDARTMTIQPWEKNMANAVEKAIRESDLGLNPASMGETIRVPMPALTEERRRELTKFIKGEGEVTVESLIRAGTIRFKPIFLTAVAAMIGAVVILTDPIFQGLAISLLFGLISSTLLTVLVIPAIYRVLRT